MYDRNVIDFLKLGRGNMENRSIKPGMKVRMRSENGTSKTKRKQLAEGRIIFRALTIRIMRSIFEDRKTSGKNSSAGQNSSTT